MILLLSYIGSKGSKCTIPVVKLLRLRGVHRALGMMSTEEEAVSSNHAGTSVRPIELPLTMLLNGFYAMQTRHEA